MTDEIQHGKQISVFQFWCVSFLLLHGKLKIGSYSRWILARIGIALQFLGISTCFFMNSCEKRVGCVLRSAVLYKTGWRKVPRTNRLMQRSLCDFWLSVKLVSTLQTCEYQLTFTTVEHHGGPSNRVLWVVCEQESWILVHYLQQCEISTCERQSTLPLPPVASEEWLFACNRGSVPIKISVKTWDV